VVSAGTVHVAVLELFSRCRTYGIDLHLEVKRDTGKLVVRIQFDVVVMNFDDSNRNSVTLVSLHADGHANLRSHVRGELIARNREHELFFARAVTLFRGNDDLLRLADGSAREFTLDERSLC